MAYYVEFQVANPEGEGVTPIVIDVDRIVSYREFGPGQTIIAIGDVSYVIDCDFRAFQRCMREWGRGHHSFDPDTGVFRTVG